MQEREGMRTHTSAEMSVSSPSSPLFVSRSRSTKRMPDGTTFFVSPRRYWILPSRMWASTSSLTIGVLRAG